MPHRCTASISALQEGQIFSSSQNALVSRTEGRDGLAVTDVAARTYGEQLLSQQPAQRPPYSDSTHLDRSASLQHEAMPETSQSVPAVQDRSLACGRLTTGCRNTIDSGAGLTEHKAKRVVKTSSSTKDGYSSSYSSDSEMPIDVIPRGHGV